MSVKAALEIPADQRYFEDYQEGSVFEFGEARVTEAAVLAFANEFDPQAFHTDAQAAKNGPFKGLIASGWHTVSMVWRLTTDHFLSSVAALGSPGLGEVSWPIPARPGDTLSARVTVLETRQSASRPEKGFVKVRVKAINQKGEIVARLEGVNLMVGTDPSRR